MFNELDILLEIQEKDMEILTLKEKEGGLAADLSQKNQVLGRLKGEMETKRSKLTEMKVARKTQEIDLDSKLATIQKMEVQLFQVKTNEGYQALQKEIEALKEKCTAVEDEILNLMEHAEKLQRDLSEGEKSVAEAEAELKKAEEVLHNEKADIAAEINRLEGEKKILASSVPQSLIERYERTIGHYGNRAIVPVADNICQGCYINLPRHTVAEIRCSGNPILCQNCSRMLYLDDR